MAFAGGSYFIPASYGYAVPGIHGRGFPSSLPFAFGLLCALMWGYVIFMKIFRRVGFEMEIIAFFLSTLSLAVTVTAFPGQGMKQALCAVLGVGLFFGLCWFLRDLNRAKRITYILVGISAFLLLVNLLFGTVRSGAQNWIVIGDSFSIQPSELVKIVFVYVGAATLDELQQRKISLYSWPFQCSVWAVWLLWAISVQL